jgi:heat shock protein HtpX
MFFLIAINFAIMIVLGAFISFVLPMFGINIGASTPLLFAAVFGFGGAFISLFLSKFFAKRMNGFRMANPENCEFEKWYVETVMELAKKAGINTPEIGIIDSDQPNAFATGWNRNDSLVCINTGLLSIMSRREVKAVLAHEIAHIQNGDMVTQTLLQGVLNTFVIYIAKILSDIVSNVLKQDNEWVKMGITFVLEIVFSILASIIAMWFSRYREYRADYGSSMLYSKEEMIKALQALNNYAKNKEYSNPLPANMTASGISSFGSEKTLMQSLFSTHPDIEERVQYLNEQK